MTHTTHTVPGAEFAQNDQVKQALPLLALPHGKTQSIISISDALREGGDFLGADAGYINLQNRTAVLVFRVTQ